MPRRKKPCNSLRCKISGYIHEKRRLKKLEWNAFQKEKEKKRKIAERIRKKENAKKAVDRGRMKATKKFDIKPTVIKSQPTKPINMNPPKPKPKPIIKKEMVKDMPAQPIMKPNAYVTVHTIKSAGVNKYPVTWKTAASTKYGRLWFATLNEAEQFAATKSREMRVNVSRINSELTGR